MDMPFKGVVFAGILTVTSILFILVILSFGGGKK